MEPREVVQKKIVVGKAKKAKKAASPAEMDTADGEAAEAKVLKKKKRKADDTEAEAPAVAEAKPKKAPKKLKKDAEPPPAAAAGDADVVKRPRTRSNSGNFEESEALAKAPPGSKAVSDFGLSAGTRAALTKRGIRVLFPIQARTFGAIFDEGADVLARARTGTGKTLAFALPVVERLLQAAKQGGHGRSPRALVLAPTRELALQVHSEFENISGGRLQHVCVYGGAPYGPQVDPLRRGVDVVVGTPGRTNDLIEKGKLDVSKLDFAILDEADQMLDMGFKDELDKIFNAMGKVEAGAGAKRQLLLFSATLPPWVQKIAKEYATHLTEIDLVGRSDGLEQIMQASTDVKHMCVPCGHWTQMHEVINDVVAAHGGGEKRSIIFCETKNECNEMVDSDKLRFERRALHGDIPQALREKTMAAFRKGAFKILIATDVAARGLDMIVDLVVNNKPPSSRAGRADPETYVHRSGRTGRAGRKGKCVTLYTPRDKYALLEIERFTKNNFEWIGAPRPADVLATAADEASVAVTAVDRAVLPMFREPAARLSKKFAADDSDDELPGATKALQACLAKLAGYEKKPQARSLLTNAANFSTCLFRANQPMYSMSYVWTALRRAIDDPAVVDSIKGMTITADTLGCVFDAPCEHLALFAACPEVECDLETVPPLKEASSKGKGSAGGRGKGGKGKGKGGKGRGAGSPGAKGKGNSSW